MKKIILLIFAVMLILGVALIGQVAGFRVRGANAQSHDNNLDEELDNSASLEDNFADNRVLVTLKSEISEEFHSYSKEDFSEISCFSVTDLTKETAQIFRQEQFKKTVRDSDVRDFNTILSLELTERSKENVLEMIKALEERDDVLYAEPDYVMTCFAAPNPYPTKYSSQ